MKLDLKKIQEWLDRESETMEKPTLQVNANRRVIMTLSEAMQANLDHGANQIEMDLGNGWELGMLSNALIASVKNYDDEFHQQGLIFSMEANGPVMSYRRDLTDAEGYLTGGYEIYYPFIID